MRTFRTKLRALLVAAAVLLGLIAFGATVGAGSAGASRISCSNISVSFKVTSSGTLDCFNDQNFGIQLPASVSYSTPSPWAVEISYYPCSNYTQNINCANGGQRVVCLNPGRSNISFQSAFGISQIDIVNESTGTC